VFQAGTTINYRCLNFLATINYYRDSFPILFPSSNLTFRDIHSEVSFSISFPPRVTQDTPLEVVTSPLKRWEYLSEVTVGRCSLSCRHLVVWVRLAKGGDWRGLREAVAVMQNRHQPAVKEQQTAEVEGSSRQLADRKGATAGRNTAG
jgi:hypothetical protein